MTRHLLVLIPLPPAAREALSARFTLHHHPQGQTPEAIAEGRQHAVVAVVTNGSTGLGADAMRQLDKLQFVYAFGAGHENIDLQAARAQGVAVAHAPDTNSETVADHALGFMLALSRGYGTLTTAVRAGEWESARAARPTLHGARLGLIGMGRIGQAIARRASAFGMALAYFGRQARAELPGRFVPDLVELARHSDYLVAACPGGPATRHLVNAAVLQALGPQGYLINVARGSVVDTGALIAALQSRAIAGAGLDVLATEPSVPPTLAAMDSVLITPHMAGRSPAAQVAQREALLDSLTRFFAGQTPVAMIVPAPASASH